MWVRKKPVHRGFECSGCGRRVHAVVATWEREVADLDCFEFQTTVVIEVHRLNCAECGPKVEKIEQVPKAPYTKRFEDRVDLWAAVGGCKRLGTPGPEFGHSGGRITKTQFGTAGSG